MHELSLAEDVVELIEQAAQREGFARVRTVFMEIGALACVVPDALRTALEFAARGTCLDGAALEIRHVDGLGQCPACGAALALETAYDVCARCGAHPLTLVHGMEMRVVELDVE